MRGYSTVCFISKLWCQVIHNHLIIKRVYYGQRSLNKCRGPLMTGTNKENHANSTEI